MRVSPQAGQQPPVPIRRANRLQSGQRRFTGEAFAAIRAFVDADAGSWWSQALTATASAVASAGAASTESAVISRSRALVRARRSCSGALRPFVVRLGQHRAGQPENRGAVGEDADDIGARPDLLVQPFFSPALGPGV